MKKVFMLMTAAAVMFGACSKDGDDNPQVEKECRVTTLGASAMYDGNTAFEYDSQSRIVKIISNDGGDDYVADFTYQSSKITVMEYYDGELDAEYEFTVNGSGLITSATGDFGGDKTFTYDNGYLKQFEVEYDHGTSNVNITYSNGNLTEVNIDNSFDSSDSRTIAYDAGKVYQPFTSYLAEPFGDVSFWGVEYALYETGYFGKLPTNRIASADNATLSYETGSDGKATRIKADAPEGYSSYNAAVGYECD
ncbi:MAG TPA: DUF4595 domain-containing protein [Parapedobacter sp.]|uniref:DUF4595 domain-containing protein n=1 Tax=Parapedobacter sp. TaxID=1958893 RepID=UPI002B89A30A|nr:DUF4595 domain-containing protein [Parapedobacter sp.]HWK57199.1 DUF4595 domain-containing protein [Parapedobacter sp.]